MVMVSLHRTHPFGDLVTRYRARKHGLSQAKLADLSELDSTVLSHMCNGRRLEGSHARERVLKVITGFYRAGALKTVEEANSLLRTARLADLDNSDPDDARLLALLEAERAPIPINPPQQPSQVQSERSPGTSLPPQSDNQKNRPDLIGRHIIGAAAIDVPLDDSHPFTVGTPVIYPRFFFGRSKELDRLFRLLRGPQLQNGAVIGPRHIGKTSLLRHMAAITLVDADSLRPGQRHNWLPHPDGYVWAYVDLRDSRLNTPKLLLSHILHQFGLPIQRKCTIEVFGQVVRDSLRLPSVILLDNIDVAVEHYSRLDYEFWVGLSSIALNDAEGRLSFIVSSQEPLAHMASHPVVGSSFFTSIVTSTELGPLEESEALELIDASPLPFPLRDVAWILVQSNLEPMPLQFLCRECLHSLEAGQRDDNWRDEALRQIDAWPK